jgi:hypothetical protein
LRDYIRVDLRKRSASALICVETSSSTLDPLPASFAAICGSAANLRTFALRDYIRVDPRERSASALICVEIGFPILDPLPKPFAKIRGPFAAIRVEKSFTTEDTERHGGGRLRRGVRD